MALTTNIRVVYINQGKHDNPHELPKNDPEGSIHTNNLGYMHTNNDTKLPEEVEKLEYIYQHFLECEKVHGIVYRVYISALSRV